MGAVAEVVSFVSDIVTNIAEVVIVIEWSCSYGGCECCCCICDLLLRMWVLLQRL